MSITIGYQIPKDQPWKYTNNIIQTTKQIVLKRVGGGRERRREGKKGGKKKRTGVGKKRGTEREMDQQTETKPDRERQRQRGCIKTSNVETVHKHDREQGTIDGGCGRKKWYSIFSQ